MVGACFGGSCFTFQVSADLIPPSSDTACRVRNTHGIILCIGGHGMPCPYKLMLPSVICTLSSVSVLCHLSVASCQCAHLLCPPESGGRGAKLRRGYVSSLPAHPLPAHPLPAHPLPAHPLLAHPLAALFYIPPPLRLTQRRNRDCDPQRVQNDIQSFL